MAFIGNQPTAVPLTSSQLADGLITTDKLAADAVTSAKILDSTIVNADIASTTINLTQKVTGTLPYANGGTGVSTLGTANQVLAVNASATALQFQSVSSDFVLLATTDASNVASVSFDGYFSSTYKNYQLIISNLYAGTNNVTGYLRFRRSNADVTASNYTTIGMNYQNAGADSQFTSSNSFGFFWIAGNYGNTSTDANSRTMMIFDPLNTTTYKNVVWSGYSKRYDGNEFISTQAVRLIDNTDALSGISFLMSSGNLYGNFKLYGIK